MKNLIPTCLALLGAGLFAPAASSQTAHLQPRTLDFPFDGIHLAPDGYLYYGGSWKGGAVYRSTLDGEVELVADGFEGPTDTVMDSKGNLFVSNYNATYISIVTPQGEVRRFAETPLGPAGMAIDAADNLYVTIYGTPAGEGHSVVKITPAGEVATYIQGPELHASVGLAVDDAGVLYVLNGRDGRIFRSLRAGHYEPFSCIPLALGRGAGAHLDWAGGFLFAASNVGAVYRIDPTGALSYVMVEGDAQRPTGPPVTPLLRDCNGLTALPDGRTLFLGCSGPKGRTLVRLEGALPRATLAAARAALQTGKLDEAERTFEELAAGEAPGPAVWMGLGAVKYRLGKFGEAGPAFEAAARTPEVAGAAHYNAGCAYALAGEVEHAFAALERALDAGFADGVLLRTDADLEALRGDERWPALAARLERRD